VIRGEAANPPLPVLRDQESNVIRDIRLFLPGISIYNAKKLLIFGIVMVSMSLLDVFQPVIVFYYAPKDIPLEKVREVFPSALEFKNPDVASFLTLSEGIRGGTSLLILDVRDGSRYVFIQPLEKRIIVVNEMTPKVYVFHPKQAGEFFSLLAKDELDKITESKLRKGNPWRFLLGGILAIVIAALSDYFSLGLWGAIILGALFSIVEYLFGPRGQKGKLINVMPSKTWSQMLKKAEKKGELERITF